MSAARHLRALASLGLAAALSLALASCTQERCVVTPCGSRTDCVESRVNVVATSVITFEDCEGGACPAIASQANASVGPSYHPSERALRINAGGEVQLRFVIARAGSGQALAAAIRCDRGATLTAGLSSLSRDYAYVLPSAIDWRRRRVTLRSAQLGVASVSGPDTVLVTLSARGQGACELDQVTLEGLTETCSRFETVVSACEACETRSWNDRDGGDWGPRLDAGSAGRTSD